MTRKVAQCAVALVLAAAILQSQAPGVAPASAQTGATALVAGRAIDAETGSPLGSVIVSIAVTPPRPGVSMPAVLADATGRFFFDNLPASSYTLTAAKPGWLPGAFGRRRPNGPSTPLDVRTGDRRADITIPMWRAGILSGTVTDEAGDPLVSADVRAFQRSYVAGHAQWTFVTRAITDDRGAYRFANLVPGDYLVALPATVKTEPAALGVQQAPPAAYSETMTALGAAPMSFDRSSVPAGSNALLVSSPLGLPRPPSADGSWLTYTTTFAMAATSIRAASVAHVVSGKETSAVNISVRPVTTFQVSGVVNDPAGSPAAFHAVHLLSSESADRPIVDASTAVTDGAGSFTFHGVPAGQYVVRIVRNPPGAGLRAGTCGGTGAISFVCATGAGPIIGPPGVPTEPLLYAEQTIAVVDRHVRGLTLALAPGPRVTGRAEFEGTADRPTDAQWTAIGVLVEPADGRSAQPQGGFDYTAPGRFSLDGTFVTPRKVPGRYLIRANNLPTGWLFKAATYQGRDVSETPFELTVDMSDIVITFTDRRGTIAGTVTSNGRPDGSATVLLFPSAASGWIDYGVTSRRIASAQTRAGAYTIPAPPDGDYLLIAVPDDQAVDWQNPAFLEKAALIADRISVRDGQSITHPLQTRQVR